MSAQLLVLALVGRSNTDIGAGTAVGTGTYFNAGGLNHILVDQLKKQRLSRPISVLQDPGEQHKKQRLRR